jgi:hypothetical protein
MLRKIVVSTFLAFIAFCVLSYASVLISLLSSVGNASQKPVTNLGFPYHYYYQFWTQGADAPNCAWSLGSFIIDFFIVWVLTVIIYLYIKRK